MINESIDVVAEPVAPVVAPVAEPVTPARTRAPRAPRAAKPVVSMPTSIADVVSIARTVNPANAAETIARINAGFVVNAPGKNVGRFTGTRIVRFQNSTLIDNVNTKLTDVQLLAVWRMEFPSAVGRVFTADVVTGVSIVRGVRAEMNRNGHGEPERIPAGFKSTAYAPTTTRIP